MATWQERIDAEIRRQAEELLEQARIWQPLGPPPIVGSNARTVYPDAIEVTGRETPGIGEPCS